MKRIMKNVRKESRIERERERRDGINDAAR